MKEKGGKMTDDQVFHAKPKVYESYFWEFLKISGWLVLITFMHLLKTLMKKCNQT